MTAAVTSEDRARLAEMGRLHRLWSPDEEPALVAHGAENTTFAVGDYIVRCSADLEAVNREVELLNTLAHATSIPTPTPELHEAELGTFAYRRLRGTPLIHRRQRDSKKIRPRSDGLSPPRDCRPIGTRTKNGTRTLCRPTAPCEAT